MAILETQMMWVIFSLPVAASLAALAMPSGGRAVAGALAKPIGAFFHRIYPRLADRARLRLAAALLDFGHNLMLCEDERRARRLERKLSGRRARRSGLEAAAIRAGAFRRDEVTLEIPIGSREQEDNPEMDARTLAHRPPSPARRRGAAPKCSGDGRVRRTIQAGLAGAQPTLRRLPRGVRRG